MKGAIPKYISSWTSLIILDLSFNKLEGSIPNFSNLKGLQTIYLTSNSLTGLIPEWISSRNSHYNIDLSYNNFTENSIPNTCRETLPVFIAYKLWRKRDHYWKCQV